MTDSFRHTRFLSRMIPVVRALPAISEYFPYLATMVSRLLEVRANPCIMLVCKQRMNADQTLFALSKRRKSKMDYMLALNVVFCTLIVILGFRLYGKTGVKAFAFVAVAYVLFGASHFSLLMGWTALKPILTAVRAGGYIFMIIGLLV
jgi:hypothetical protein